jgi:serine protease Do
MSNKFTMKRFLAATAVVGLLTTGAVTSTLVRGDSSPDAAPVVYETAAAPNVSAEEAARAVASAKDLSTAFRVAADKVLPAVVTIETKGKPKSAAVSGRNQRSNPPAPRGNPVQPFSGRNPFSGTPFEDMFKDFAMGEEHGFRFGPEEGSPSRPPLGGSRPRQGLGSGVIIDRDGYILTNNHVVAGGDDVTVLVRLWDGREFPATQVWTDPKTDIAVVKIDGASDLVTAPLANSDVVSVGDWVLALGQPFGLESTVTAGIVSATHRSVGINARESFLQTDAAINPGNSGGPLVNLDGEIVGINTAISSRGGGNDGVGFAVPSNLAKWVADQLVSHGEVRRAYLGVGIQPVTADLAKQFKVKPREGVVVTDVYPDTPAAKAGLQAGDVVRSFAGVKVDSPRELQLLVERAELGRPHAMELVRDGKSVNVSFVPEEQPAEFESRAGRQGSAGSGPAAPSSVDALGLEITDLDANVAKQLGVPVDKGVVVTDVVAGSVAQQAGLESGMVIVQINRQPVSNAAEARQQLSGYKPGDNLLLLVRTSAGSRFIAIGN